MQIIIRLNFLISNLITHLIQIIYVNIVKFQLFFINKAKHNRISDILYKFLIRRIKTNTFSSYRSLISIIPWTISCPRSDRTGPNRGDLRSGRHRSRQTPPLSGCWARRISRPKSSTRALVPCAPKRRASQSMAESLRNC